MEQLIAIAIALAVIIIIWSMHRKYTYWQRRGVPCLTPEIPFGNVRNIGRTTHYTFKLKEIYDQMKGSGPLCGAYAFHRPFIVLLDLTLIKQVLVKDFAYFTDRGMYFNEHDDPLSANLFMIDGSKWKAMRAKVSTAFTTGKMKFMYPTVMEVGERFQQTLSSLVCAGAKELEMKDLFARFTTDVIGTCAFGIQCNSLLDPASEFREMGRRSIEEPKHCFWASVLISSFTRLSRWLGTRVIRDDVAEFFLNVVRETVEYREKYNVTRNDFMDLLIKLKKSDGIDGLKIEEVAAQTYIFFLAGFETSSSTLSHCFYELAMNDDIQTRARQEVCTTLARHAGELTYQALTEMPYIDQIINGRF